MPCAYCELTGADADHPHCHKLCPRCPLAGRPQWQPLDQFSPTAQQSPRLKAICKRCNTRVSLDCRARRRSAPAEVPPPTPEHALPPPTSPVVESTHTPAVLHQRAPQLAKADYAALFETQGGRCAACDRVEWLIVRGRKADLRLYVWGVVGQALQKALICRRCDSMIEEADDDPAVVARLLGFLTQNPSVRRQGRLHVAETPEPPDES